ncbi:MAG: hypothetical protein JSR85_07760 [Proteobacteria bacterium]|nr:hypothetical protein [Pseudomonadota bacterium]
MMLSNSLFLILSFLSLSSAFAASDRKDWRGPEESGERTVFCLAQEREKTADEILAELQDKPEYMSCQNWLSRNHPDVDQNSLERHPLFPLLRDAMALADFELDVFEQFIQEYMKPETRREEAETIQTVHYNMVSAKNFVFALVKVLQETTTPEQMLEHYFQDRFCDLVDYTATLRGKKETFFKGIKSVRIPEDDPRLAAFMRSYNTKLNIARTLLYYVKDKEPSIPLSTKLSPKLVGLIRMSTSLHPFLAKESEEWIGYDAALSGGEARNFLGNAADLGINLRTLLSKQRISYVKPKVYKKIRDFSLFSFLDGALQEEHPSAKAKKKERKRKKKREDTATAVEVSEDLSSPAAGATAVVGRKSPSSPVAELLPEVPEDLPAAAAALPPPAEIELESLLQRRTRNKHVDTIYNIFNRQGYKLLDDTKIIAAWNHVLEGRGYHKESTGRSHQPLYASLTDGSQVVLGLFRSNGYGPRYIQYVRDAFDKIGFGREWLALQGYHLE